MDPQTHCPIFSLPRELRDIIYTYAFTTKTRRKHIQLHHAAAVAPQITLALTCRRIHAETIPLHKAAYAAFWSSKTFFISRNYTFDFIVRTNRLTAKHIQQMTRVALDIKDLEWWGEGRRFILVSEAGRDDWTAVKPGVLSGLLAAFVIGRSLFGPELKGYRLSELLTALARFPSQSY